MTRMTGPDCVVMCNLINTYIHTYLHTYIHTYIQIHTYIHTTYIGVPGGFARRHDGGPPVEGNLRQEPGIA